MLFDWAARRPEVTPFVTDPAARSQVVATLDIDEEIDATAVTSVLRGHGVVDIEPYRKLGRNQIRVGTFPRSEEHTSELQSRGHLVCRLLLEKKKHINP